MVKSNEEMASDFIVGTSQLIPKLSSSSSSEHMHDLAFSDETLTKGYAIDCGSEAEFYIRPLKFYMHWRQ